MALKIYACENEKSGQHIYRRFVECLFYLLEYSTAGTENHLQPPVNSITTACFSPITGSTMRPFYKPLWLTAIALSLLWHTGWGSPSALLDAGYDSLDANSTSFSALDVVGVKRQDEDRVPLRILPFGASIMSGMGSSTNDG